MTRRGQLIAVLGLVVGLLIILLVWRAPREGEFEPPSPVSPMALPPISRPLFPSPLRAPTATSLYSPLPLPPTAQPPVTTATLQAIRATRPTATPPSPSGVQLPYISPATWRAWALRILAAAGVLAFIGLRLRSSQ